MLNQTLCGQTTGCWGCGESGRKKEQGEGGEGKWEECVWVWDCHPMEGSSCGVLIEIQQNVEEG